MYIVKTKSGASTEQYRGYSPEEIAVMVFMLLDGVSSIHQKFVCIVIVCQL